MNATGWDCLISSPMKIRVLPGHWKLLQIATVITGEGLAKCYRKYSHYNRHENYRSRCPFLAAAPGDSLAPPHSPSCLCWTQQPRELTSWEGEAGAAIMTQLLLEKWYGPTTNSFKLRLSVKKENIWLQAMLALSQFYKCWEQLQALS